MPCCRATHAGFLAFLLFTSSALAAQRTFVASYGNDGNPCSIALPCRSFTAALLQTNVGGEIVVVDSAGYGQVTIAKSVAIIAPSGVHAGVSVAAGDGIIVNAAGIEVTLRGLTISGQGGDNGIRFLNGSSLSIEHCVISGMSSGGIRSEVAGTLRVQDTIASDNDGSGITINAGDATLVRVHSERNGLRGVDFGNSTGAVHGGSFSNNGFEGIAVHNVPTATTRVAIDGATISHNVGDGIQVFSANAAGLVAVTVSNSVISTNGGYGISVVGTVNGGPARLHAADNMIANNERDGIDAGTNTGSTVYASATRNVVAENQTGGIRAGNAGTTFVAESNVVVRNTGHGLTQGGGSVFYSRGNNTVNGNTSGSSFGSLTPLGGL
jgi:hypothetical protein